MKRGTAFASLLIVSSLVIIIVGLKSDLQVFPPPFGPGCRIAEADIREQTPPPSNPPPPSRAAYGVDGEKTVEETLPLFEWDQLSARAGYGLTSSRDSETWARRLGAGWYVDWRILKRYPTELPEHWQMIRLGRGCMYPTKEALSWLAARYPGNVWIVGNEPDNIWQDKVVPEEYAQVYHDVYYLLKEADPTAKVAVAGVTQGTPLRLAYLDRVIDIYEALYNEPMPVDWWTLHGFVLREEGGNWGAEIPVGIYAPDGGMLYEPEDVGSVEYFKDHILNFRTWMAENGYQNTPLAITEYGILLPPEYGYTPEIVAQYLVDTFTWLDTATDAEIGYPADENRLVQRWAWFSLYDPLYETSNLANIQADAITDIGMAFRNFVQDRTP